jgi:hypothetical protein
MESRDERLDDGPAKDEEPERPDVTGRLERDELVLPDGRRLLLYSRSDAPA